MFPTKNKKKLQKTSYKKDDKPMIRIYYINVKEGTYIISALNNNKKGSQVDIILYDQQTLMEQE